MTTTTTTTTKIAELTLLVKEAFTATAEGRQVVIDSCKELYNLIEEDVAAADKEWMLKGMYNDLCAGDFAEPFMCDLKKGTFNTVVAVYNERVVPFI